ncbi:CST complex subunit STN1 [Lampris incognitus]|uniref:CST complex subunit STN1 n=1 Tax=Lampris incognitus TaxID=2546036 RepID=UPI0024B5B3C7|nr:CST complex subunit STN1 [Lampris incognitus]
MCVLKNFFKEKAVTKFRPYEVQDLLQHLVSSRSSTSSANQGEETQTPHLGNPTQKSLDTPLTQEPVAGPSGGQQLRQLLQEALQILQEEGTVFRKVRSQDEVYHVTEQDKGLLIAVKDVIRKDSRTEKYAEKGCHILHILSAVRQCYSPNVSKAAVERILNSLESNSDIISTSDSHYTIFGQTTSLGQS